MAASYLLHRTKSLSLSLSISFSLAFLLLVLTAQTSAQCNTADNPSCAGNRLFEALCCPPGSICYWSNRNGDPACCAAGTSCDGDGGPSFVAPLQATAVQATTYYAQTTYTSTLASQSTVTKYQSISSVSPTLSFVTLSTVATPAVVVVTDTFPVVATQPVATNGAYVTVTQVQVVGEGVALGGGLRVVVWAAVAGTVVAVVFAVFG